MEYESDILKRLIKTYGVVGNPRYISEIIKEFIVQGKERFPELFTYQSEWLAHIDEFGLTPEYTVSYTGQHIYAPNTLEKPVKSAILTGCTLVNIFQDMDYVWNNLTKQDNFNYDNEDLIILNNGNPDGRYWNTLPKIPNIKSNTEYTMIFTKSGSPRVEFGTIDENGQPSALKRFTNAQKVKITSPNNGDLRVKFCIGNPSSEESPINLGKVMLIEGDYTNIDVPYFEGMQSVKMPVLTSSGKNLFEEEWVQGTINATHANFITTKNIINVPSGKTLTFSNSLSLPIQDYHLYYNGEFIQSITSYRKNTVAIPSNANGIKITIYNSGGINPISLTFAQLEEGTTPTTYEPYKTNILTVNEDVTLRSNGNICDELNLLTGQLTQRIDEDGEVLSQEVVKTVDLTILDQYGQNVKQLMTFNGGTHFNTKSLEGSPLPSISVSVETDLVETLKVCSLEGNTM